MPNNRLHGRSTLFVWLIAACLLLFTNAGYAFVAFETGQVRPLAQSSDGSRLFAVNTPDNQLEIYSVSGFGLTHEYSVPVGLEPVALALRNDNEVWVVNHLSDSVTIINVSVSPPRITRTLLVGDEPRDIVFAGPGGNRAFITTAHRGQNSQVSISSMPANPGELITPGIGRADVWVFDATSLGTGLGGTPETIITLFGDTPRPLAVSPDGSTVYAGIFHSGNRSTVIPEGAVCDGGAGAAPCFDADAQSPGGLPTPNASAGNVAQHETGLIVRYDGTHWVDELNRQWDGLVRFNLPDKDVFAIDATANPPVESTFYTGAGTILYNMAVNPVSGKLYVANTEAINEVRFEGTRAINDPTSTVLGHQHETRITVIDPGGSTVTPRHLNKHIDYSVSPAAAGVADNSLALPRQLAISSDGGMLYLAAKGSDKVGVFSVAALENDSFVPDSADHIPVSGGGPAGLLLDEANNRLYVTTRFDNGISIIDLASRTETAHIPLHNPEPADLVAGRRFLYDARYTSSNGEAACASCHVDSDLDSLAWDLGDPTGSVLNNPLDTTLAGGGQDFHPMKGPMTTQTLRGMDGHGSMHWRGDRTGGNDEPNSVPNGDGGAYNEALSFSKFNVAFPGLLGRATQLSTTEMDQFTAFILQVLPPPNPIRNLDDSLTASQDDGREFFFNHVSDIVTTCNGCHVLDPPNSFFGTSGLSSFEAEPQDFKVAQLRNMYSKVGMFGMADVNFFNPGNNAHQGDQVRGFGFLHDGSVDSVFRFLNAALFDFNTASDPNITHKKTPDEHRRDVEQFIFAFDSNMKPVVGQQVTLYPGAPAGTGDPNNDNPFDRAYLLTLRADAGDCDVVVKGNFIGLQRGGRYLGSGNFQLDGVDFPSISESVMLTQAFNAGETVTYTAVPPGEGVRIGIDRDLDTVLNKDDNCPVTANLDQDDSSDSDTIGDACDNCVGTANTNQLDTDTDGQGNACDADDDNDGLSDLIEDPNSNGIVDPGETDSLDTDTDGDGLPDGVEDANANGSVDAGETDPRSADSDGDGLDDGVDPIPTVFNFNDGDANDNGGVDSGDYLMTLQAIFDPGLVDDNLLSRVDLYPDGAPDGTIGLQDLLKLTPLLFP